jgi:hypothetical protein
MFADDVCFPSIDDKQRRIFKESYENESYDSSRWIVMNFPCENTIHSICLTFVIHRCFVRHQEKTMNLQDFASSHSIEITRTNRRTISSEFHMNNCIMNRTMYDTDRYRMEYNLSMNNTRTMYMLSRIFSFDTTIRCSYVFVYD